MEKISSRIPKLTFGFKKSPSKTNGTVSEGNSPRNGTKPRPQTPPSNSRSAPGSQNSSPNLSRSKSLRVPNSLHKNSLKSHSSSKLSERNEDTESDDYYPENGKRDLRSVAAVGGKSDLTFLPHPRPRSKTIGPGSRSVSNPNSRNSSPRRTVEAEEEEEGNTDDSLLQDDPSSFQRRTKSFSAKRHNLSNTNISARSSALTRAHSVRRSRTPNSLVGNTHGRDRTDSDTPTNDTKGVGGEGGGSGIVRTSSSGHTTRNSTQVPLRNSTTSTSTRRGSIGSGSRGKRPSSSFISEEDFNLEHGAGVRGSESSLSPNPPGAGGDAKTVRGSLSAPGSVVSKRSHSSIGYSYSDPRSPSPTSTTTSSNSSAQGIGDSVLPKSSRLLSSKHRSLSSNENLSRPSSATAYYSRRGSGTKDAATGKPSSTTPINGGGAPSQRRTSGGKDATDGGVVSIPTAKTTSALPPRTPYRVARTKAAPSSDLTGMNELEGSVLLEADDYRRLLNEVKALKTALLKLKRELQVDSESTPAGLNNTNLRIGRSRTSPIPGQISSTEYNKKLKAVATEKELLSGELTKLKKEGKMKNSRIESFVKELAKEQEEHKKVVEELAMVSGQRNRLLDKVERLHADKHTLEARLNTLERASIYEQTWSDNWMDELDGEELEDNGEESTSFGDSLDTDPLSSASGGSSKKGGAGGRRKGMDSDVVDSFHSDGGEGENSEPESTAVCSAPII